jgi:hypothetical protein
MVELTSSWYHEYYFEESGRFCEYYILYTIYSYKTSVGQSITTAVQWNLV